MSFNQKLVIALIAVVPLAAQAADETGKGYINPQGGWVWADNHRDVDDDAYYGLGIGKHVSERWSVELNGITSQHDLIGGSGELNLSGVSLDGLRVFRRAKSVSPFLSLGIGYMKDNFDPGGREGDWLGQVGAGLLLDLAENQNGSFVFQLRPEIKARWDGNEVGDRSHGVDYLAGIGLTFAFGPERRQPVSTPAPQPIVQAEPEPEPEPEPTRPESLQQPLVLEGMHFETNSDRLAEASHPVLDELAAELRDYPRVRLEIQGHSDSTGDATYNLNLSQRRAESVRQHLITRGIAAERLQAKGYGETQPIADNRTPAGRATNRRVVLRVIDNPSDVEVDIRE